MTDEQKKLAILISIGLICFWIPSIILSTINEKIYFYQKTNCFTNSINILPKYECFLKDCFCYCDSLPNCSNITDTQPCCTNTCCLEYNSEKICINNVSQTCTNYCGMSQLYIFNISYEVIDNLKINIKKSIKCNFDNSTCNNNSLIIINNYENNCWYNKLNYQDISFLEISSYHEKEKYIKIRKIFQIIYLIIFILSNLYYRKALIK